MTCRDRSMNNSYPQGRIALLPPWSSNWGFIFHLQQQIGQTACYNSSRGGSMANLSGIMQQLKKERDRVERELSGLNAALAAFVNVYAGKSKPTTGRKRRKMSVAARKKIAAAQRARWAKARKQSQPTVAGAAKTSGSA